MNEEKLAQLLSQFRQYGISQEPSKKEGGLKDVLDFQDVIGRSTLVEIGATFKKMDHASQELFLWSCNLCLDMQTSIGIWKQCVYGHVNGQVQDQFKRIRELEQRVKELTAQVEELEAYKMEMAPYRTVVSSIKQTLELANV